MYHIHSSSSLMNTSRASGSATILPQWKRNPFQNPKETRSSITYCSKQSCSHGRAKAQPRHSHCTAKAQTRHRQGKATAQPRHHCCIYIASITSDGSAKLLLAQVLSRTPQKAINEANKFTLRSRYCLSISPASQIYTRTIKRNCPPTREARPYGLSCPFTLSPLCLSLLLFFFLRNTQYGDKLLQLV